MLNFISERAKNGVQHMRRTLSESGEEPYEESSEEWLTDEDLSEDDVAKSGLLDGLLNLCDAIEKNTPDHQKSLLEALLSLIDASLNSNTLQKLACPLQQLIKLSTNSEEVRHTIQTLRELVISLQDWINGLHSTFDAQCLVAP